MTERELGQICFEYLRTINPLASRIGDDIVKLKSEYGPQWAHLSHEEQKRLVDSDQIDQQLVLKYVSQSETDEDFTYVSPFCWFTKSQLNLYSHIDVKPKTHSKTPVKRLEVFSPLKRSKDDSENVVTRIKNKVMKSPNGDKQVVKPKSHPPPPPGGAKRVTQRPIPNSDSQDDIPKTGFDFLDNW